MKLENLIEKAEYYYQHKEYDKELDIWEKVLQIEPYNPHWKHNIALVLTHLERNEEASILFEELINTNPELSRVHNNYAYTLLKMGAEAETIIPFQEVALKTSNDIGEFFRHFHNCAITISLSFCFNEPGGLIKKLKETAYHISENFILPPLALNFYYLKIDKAISAYCDILNYRKCLVQKKWKDAENYLILAHNKFTEEKILVLKNIIEFVIMPNFNILTRTFQILEMLASGEYLNFSIAEKHLDVMKEIIIFYNKNSAIGFHRKLADITYSFIKVLVSVTKFLTEDEKNLYKLDYFIEYDAYTKNDNFFHLDKEYSEIINICKEQIIIVNDFMNTTLLPNEVIKKKKNALKSIMFFINGRSFSSQYLDRLIASQAIDVNVVNEPSALTKLIDFKHFIERQCTKDIYVNNKPQEYIARSLLQVHLTSRSYREVQTRGGYTDILTFEKEGRYLYEIKIWRGLKYYKQGLREIDEYIKGENDDGELKKIFYIIFDPTKNNMAEKEARKCSFKHIVRNYEINIVVININLKQPSRI